MGNYKKIGGKQYMEERTYKLKADARRYAIRLRNRHNKWGIRVVPEKRYGKTRYITYVYRHVN